MAITISLDASLDVTSKYEELVKSALGGDSPYIRVKETLDELADNGQIDGVDKGKILAEVLASYSTNVSNSAMQTALAWEAKEKELALGKIELEYKLAVLAQEEIKAQNEVLLSLASRQKVQAESLRVYGTHTTDTEGNVVLLGDNGKVWTDMQNVIQDTANKALLPEQIAAQTDEVQARTHKLVADTYVNHGLFTGYTVGPAGISSATKVATGYTTLSDLNKEVAREQAKGYAWNAWSNAATSSASMIGTVVAAEIPDLDYSPYFTIWSTAVGKLNNIVAPSISV